MLHVLTTVYNCEPYLKRCLRSISAQSEEGFRCWLLDDVSTDGSADICREWAHSDPRFRHVRKTRKFWQVGNYDRMLRHVLTDPGFIGADDLIVPIDGDDYLPHDEVFRGVVDRYAADPALWFTWGSFVIDHNDGTPLARMERGHCARPLAPGDWPRLRDPEFPWSLGCLRTWRAWLWRRIDPADLRDPATGDYWQAAGDVAFALPLVEMAGPAHAAYVPEINYVYNHANPLSEFRTAAESAARTVAAVKRKTPYCAVGGAEGRVLRNA